jgi:hypothetical protein
MGRTGFEAIFRWYLGWDVYFVKLGVIVKKNKEMGWTL